ncbi:MAG TPA: hypothetical protein VGY57_00895 [Vicinamibacterales bacterium]|nr:hypothetical protein [Vicinamibacterales bacterium]
MALGALLIAGAVTTVLGQTAGTKGGAPGARFRFGLAIVPFLVIGLTALSLRRSRAYEVVLILTAHSRVSLGL